MHDFIPPLEPPAVWRRLRLTDAPALAEMMAALDAAEGLDEVAGPDLIRWFLDLPSIDLEHDTVGAFSPDGRALADAEIMIRGGDGTRRAVVFVNAHPDHNDLEPPLLAWAERRARLRLADDPQAPAGDIRIIVEEHRTRFRAVIEEAGFVEARHFAKMRLPLPTDLAESSLPDGITIERWTPERDRSAWDASNESFRDHWGSAEHSWDDWLASYADDPDAFLPEHSFLALADDEVVAFCLCEEDPEQTERTGTREFWVGRVGTRDAWRKRGLGTALIVRSLQSAMAAGYGSSALTVDEESQTNATAIYERIGFRTVDREIHYTKQG